MRRALVGLVLVVGVWVVWHHIAGDGEATVGDTSLLFDRPWIDHMPRTETETVQVFFAVARENLGSFLATSRWKGSYEVFTYRAGGGGELRITYPQTRQTETAKFSARRCSERGFDYCLEVAGASRGVKRYYSKREWEGRAAGSLDSAKLEVERILAGASAGASP